MTKFVFRKTALVMSILFVGMGIMMINGGWGMTPIATNSDYAEPTFWWHEGIRAEVFGDKVENPEWDEQNPHATPRGVLTIQNEAELGLFAWEMIVSSGYQFESWGQALSYEGNGRFLWNRLLVYNYTPVDFSHWTVKLGRDMNLSGYEWLPVALAPYINFDGDNYAISNMLINHKKGITNRGFSNLQGDWHAGLFSTIDRSVVRNLSLVTPRIDLYTNGGSYWEETNLHIGSIAGKIYGSRVINVTVENPYITFNTSHNFYFTMYVGGIVGAMTSSELPNDIGLTSSNIVGSEVRGGNINCDVTYFDDREGARLELYMGGIAGSSFESIIGSSCVRETNLAATTYDYSLRQNNLFMGGIAGYSSMELEAQSGTCILNNSVFMTTFETNGSWRNKALGSIAGFVVNDSVVNNLFVGPMADTMPLIGKLYIGNIGQYLGDWEYLDSGWEFVYRWRVTNPEASFQHAMENGTPFYFGNDRIDQTVNERRYIISHNYAFTDPTEARNYTRDGMTLIELLNDTTPNVGGKWWAVQVNLMSPNEYITDIEFALSRYRVWAWNENNEPALANFHGEDTTTTPPTEPDTGDDNDGDGDADGCCDDEEEFSNRTNTAAKIIGITTLFAVLIGLLYYLIKQNRNQQKQS
ncbi:MAG: hypothetical protein FWC00_02225 [Firmicutes bacterium]|nr:hypothetical protein [Bacillota bacterium]